MLTTGFNAYLNGTGAAAKLIRSVSIKNGFGVLFGGLAATQIIATLHIRHTNQVLHQKMLAIAEAGFVAVPNEMVQPLLMMVKPAFWGGLFISATLGPLLLLLTMAAVMTAMNLPKGKPLPPLLLWLGLMLWGNQQGFHIFATAYVTVVPMVSALLAQRKTVTVSKKVWAAILFSGSAGVIVPALLLISATPEYGFIRLRDRLLLGHTIGRHINHFYYQYTLFAAEAIKSNCQKQMISYRIEPQESTGFHVQRLAESLVGYDYLWLDQPPAELLFTVQANQALVLEDRNGISLKTSLEEALSTPEKILKQFSARSDRNRGLRHLLLMGLLVGLPVVVFTGLYFSVYPVLKWWFPTGVAAMGSGFLCLGVGVSFWWLLWTPGPLPDSPDELIRILKNGRRHERLDALEALVQQHFDITTFTDYPKLLGSSDSAMRYKVARALQYAPHYQNRQDLVLLLTDPNPNVRCMALQSLGRWGDPDEIPLLLNTIRTSDHWYVQFYAYRALKMLGWNQPNNSRGALSGKPSSRGKTDDRKTD